VTQINDKNLSYDEALAVGSSIGSIVTNIHIPPFSIQAKLNSFTLDINDKDSWQ